MSNSAPAFEIVAGGSPCQAFGVECLFEPEIMSMAGDLIGLYGCPVKVQKAFQNPTNDYNKLIKALFLASEIHCDNELYSANLSKMYCVAMTVSWPVLSCLVSHRCWCANYQLSDQIFVCYELMSYGLWLVCLLFALI